MSPMPTAVLGRSGVSVSRICLGSMNFGGPTPAEEALDIMAHAAEQGVTFLDTSNNYCEGRAEEIVGRCIRSGRDRWFIATKVGNQIAPGPNGRGLSRHHVHRAVETSLRKLGTETIDLYYTHRIDPNTPWEDVARTFGDLIRAGKIRYWGLSNVRAWQIAHIVHVCRSQGDPEPVALQPYYNLMNRQPEVEVLPAARQFGLGIVPYSPIARGILTGKYQLNVAPAADSRAGRRDKRVMEAEWRPESLEIAEALKAHAEMRGRTLADFAVAWVLNNSAVTSVIAGPRTLAQWQSYPGALSYPWSAEDEAVVDRLIQPGHPSTPGFTDPAYPVEGRYPRIAGSH